MAKQLPLNVEYSLRQIERGRELRAEHNDNTPLFVPVGCEQPETYNQAIARILHHSGVIDDSAYEKLRGNVFDIERDDDESFDDDDFDLMADSDEFKQSEYADYEPLEFDGHIVDSATNAPSEAKQEQKRDSADSAPQVHTQDSAPVFHEAPKNPVPTADSIGKIDSPQLPKVES